MNIQATLQYYGIKSIESSQCSSSTDESLNAIYTLTSILEYRDKSIIK